MIKIFLSIFITILAISGLAQQKKPVKVLLLGAFHFDNPGLDVAKFKNVNILSENRQKEVMEVVSDIRKFGPTKIFIESIPERQASIDSSLAEYKSGKMQLKPGEIYQIAYRLAKELNLPAIYAVDYRDADFPFDSLMKSAVEAGQMEFVSWVQKMIETVERSFNQAVEKSTIKELLLRENTPEAIRMQVDFYFKLLPVGKPGNHVGAYLVSEWWRRNMVIYENILKRLDGREERILVLFGSGHTAMLNEMMKFNPDIELIPVESILKSGNR